MLSHDRVWAAIDALASRYGMTASGLARKAGLDATSLTRVAGPLPLQTALTYAREQGAPHIFHQAVDKRGRLMGDPARLGR